MRRASIITAGMLAGMTAQAAAQTDAQRDVVRQLSEATILAQSCTGQAIDGDVERATIERAGIDPAHMRDGGPYDLIALTTMRETMATLDAATGDGPCEAALIMYGETGASIPGLIVAE
ncbi:hypothetical protein [Mesorhizobium sp. CAU 1732]|uniref:hypothetical protein n=1 Tax=Mesorhizobium sp. CAU 1732 TaxID=3140358 RepID=UPI003261146A